jgi:hypothetical protein
MMLILAKSICLSSFLQRLRRCNNQGEPSTMDVTMDIGIGCPAGAGQALRHPILLLLQRRTPEHSLFSDKDVYKKISTSVERGKKKGGEYMS